MLSDERTLAQVLTECLADLDLSSADGRAGLGAVMRQLEEEVPDQIQASAARLQLRAAGLPARR
ncbi:MAG TPA: hypothetical protein VN018_07805 [Brevundimonas sp.]|nr:hypothetical protein [Brevundimonas sp.]